MNSLKRAKAVAVRQADVRVSMCGTTPHAIHNRGSESWGNRTHTQKEDKPLPIILLIRVVTPVPQRDPVAWAVLCSHVCRGSEPNAPNRHHHHHQPALDGQGRWTTKKKPRVRRVRLSLCLLVPPTHPPTHSGHTTHVSRQPPRYFLHTAHACHGPWARPLAATT